MATSPDEPVLDEVRTRRVVVVDEAGRPRITIGVERGAASVRVDAAGGDPSVEVYAVDALEGDGPEVGLALVVDGDVVTDLHLLVSRRSTR